MKLFRSNRLNDVIFLEPVRKIDEKLPKGKMRMLCCDAKGKVYAVILNTNVYKLVMEYVSSMGYTNKDYATIGLEIGPGNFLPFIVEVSPREIRVLDHVLEHARKKGIIPTVLRKELQQIIRLGDLGRKGKRAEKQSNARIVTSMATPGILARLPYYAEKDIEFSMPIYKASHKYPLIVLNRLQTDKNDAYDTGRLLIMDSDGDLAIIKAPVKLMTLSEKRLEEWTAKTDMHACIVIAKSEKGLDINYVMINKQQKKALDTIAKRFEETGNGKLPVTTSAKKVLIQARDITADLTD